MIMFLFTYLNTFFITKFDDKKCMEKKKKSFEYMTGILMTIVYLTNMNW